MLFPSPESFINIHSHKKPALPNEFVIRNAYLSNSISRIVQLPYAISVGLHPWHIKQQTPKELSELLLEYATLRNVLAIGEIGIDKAIETPVAIQLKLFEVQYQVARALQKPVLLHTVKAYNEMIPFLKKTKVPFIFHGFSGNVQQAKELIKHGAILSFGKNLWSDKSKEVLLILPKHSFFLETDNAAITIDKIYAQAASILQVETDEIKSDLFNTFAQLFR
ncbi:MAG: TatD family hydrolase [Bacteroidia bacterium]|nr:TatD family hydrolase [Bacteroidia bacterium]